MYIRYMYIYMYILYVYFKYNINNLYKLLFLALIDPSILLFSFAFFAVPYGTCTYLNSSLHLHSLTKIIDRI